MQSLDKVFGRIAVGGVALSFGASMINSCIYDGECLNACKSNRCVLSGRISQLCEPLRLTDGFVWGSVDGGKMAVMFNRFPNPFLGEPAGIQRKVIGEGTHFKIPWLQDPKVFDVRTRPRAIPTVTGTKDLQVSKLVFTLSG